MTDAALDPEECPHELDAEYLYPNDVAVLDVEGAAGELRITLAVPCPDCDHALELSTTVESVTESALSLPLDDAEDVYD